jgi:hypothetical protein
MSAPTDLEQLSHGRGQLRPAPAASIWRIDVALGHPVDINRAYASLSQQYIYYRAYQNYLNGGPWAPLALHPDLSWHCKGMAVDTDESPRTVPSTAQIWADNGWRFEVQSEPWHGQYYTSLDRNYGKPAGGGSVPFPTPEPTPDEPPAAPPRRSKAMVTFWTIATDGKPIWALAGASPGVAGANWIETRQQATANSFAAQTGGSTELTVAQWDSIRKAFMGPVTTA